MAWGRQKNTPAQIVDKLNDEINLGLADPTMKALGGAVMPGSPTNFGKLIAAETKKWANVVTFAGLKPALAEYALHSITSDTRIPREVRFGSLADIFLANWDVRLTTKSGHSLCH